MIQNFINQGLMRSPRRRPLVLDRVPGAIGAWSVFLLSFLYKGNCLRIRRASDDEELDIGFVAGLLDIAAIAAFCAGTDGFVVNWYDGTGNGHTATTTAEPDQPKIHDSVTGILLDANGKPIICFDGNDDFMAANGVASVLNGEDKPYSVFTKHLIPSSVSAECIWSFGDSASNNDYIRYRKTNVDTLNILKSDSTTFRNLFGFGVTSLQVTSVIDSGVLGNLWQNSAHTVTDANMDLPAITIDRFTIGALGRVGEGNFAEVDLSEIIIYPSDQTSNQAAIAQNRMEQFEIS